MRKGTQDPRPKTHGKTKKDLSLESRVLSPACDFLLEIGTEELPAAYLDGAIAQLYEDAGRLLREAHLNFISMETFGTPRRLVLLVSDLENVQHNPPEEIRGPSKQAAFDAGGKPTEAVKGFLRGRGGTLAHIKTVSTEKGDYIYLVKPERHTPTAAVLPQLVARLLGRLRFPKTMRWDESGFRFARPVRWLVVLYGNTPVKVSAGRVKSGCSTWIGGPQRPKLVTISNLADYLATLKRACIILDQRRRRNDIKQLIEAAAKQQHAVDVGVPAPEVVSHGLLDEITHLVERPVSLVGQFDPKYLVLPREVLLASMAKYQRVCAIQTSAGKLLPKFVAILDGKPRTPERVRQMYEHILNARLADSLLFWNQDHRELPLDRMSQCLNDVSFHEKLGSMAEKATRLEAIGKTLVEIWNLSDVEANHLLRAARLAKADLVSRVVKEFPTLQGVVGKYYALGSNETGEVAQAIEEQYWLREETEEQRHLNAGRVPGGLTSLGLIIVDRFDTLTSYFGLGIEPTGSQDPFGLRRCAQGIVDAAFLLGERYSLLLKRLFRTRCQFAPFNQMEQSRSDQVYQRVSQYIYERLYNFNPLWSADVIQAVLDSDREDLANVLQRVEILNQLCGATHLRPQLLQAAKVVERTNNILKGIAIGSLEDPLPSLLHEPEERQLWELYTTNKNRLTQLVLQKLYVDATTLYGDVFFGPLHQFFENVMVNVNDEAIQQNRLALMKAINVLYTEHIADLSKLAILEPRPTPSQPSA